MSQNNQVKGSIYVISTNLNFILVNIRSHPLRIRAYPDEILRVIYAEGTQYQPGDASEEGGEGGGEGGYDDTMDDDDNDDNYDESYDYDGYETDGDDMDWNQSDVAFDYSSLMEA